MDNSNQNNSKTPPFVYPGAPGQSATGKSASRPSPTRPLSKKNSPHPSERGMLSVTILLISSISLGIALTSGAWIGIGVLQSGLGNQSGLFARIAAAGLAYLVGWIVSFFGMRKLGNLILPLVIKMYAWLILGGLAALQIAIISKLFKQVYTLDRFVAYVIMFGAGLVALIGIHLLIEKHNLVPFSFPILIISLAHLYLIVFHYVFVPDGKVEYEFIWGDIAFFLITATVGVLMLAHLGILSAFRNRIDNKFSENTNHFVPPR